MTNNHDRYKRMVENSQDWFWEFDENANFTYASPRIKDLLGYEPEEIIGQNAFDLMSDEEANRVREHFDPIAKKYLPFNHLENTNIHRDGHEVILESSGTPIFDKEGEFRGYRGIDRDITLRRKAEEGLREREVKFQSIVDSSAEWIWEMDLMGRHTYSNHRLEELLGYSLGDFVGKEYSEFLHRDDLQEVQETLPGLISEKRGWSGWVLRWLHKDGDYHYLESNAKPIINSAGEVEGFRGADRDITERKVFEEALFAATRAVEAADKTKGMFLAKVSHELRTPMTAIIGFGELLESSELTAEERKYLAALNASSKVLSSMIEDILDLSKVEAGELSIKPKPFGLRSIISKIIDMQERQIAEKGLQLNVRIEDDVPDSLIGDSLRIKQVLLNLLSNAVKFTEKGTICLEVAVAEENRGRVLLDVSVIDTGVGISEGLQENIFEPFVRGDENNHHGAGLGLAISRSLVGLMGGTIRCESQLGSGSTFQFLLPLKSEGENLSVKRPQEIDSIKWSCPALKILLAEDNSINSQFMTAALENMGHVVIHAENGRIALDALRVNRFDVVLMDIEMPIMNGVDALRAIRHLEKSGRSALKVIAMTAYALMGDQEKYLKMGFDGYLSKPFMTKDLVNVLKRVVSG